jgi:GntR family transcriptional regulator / MocR family aminotransferase
MLPFYTLINIHKELGIPVYQQVANALVNLIREGRIPPGAALPSSRKMSQLLQVHRKTVIAAYEELGAQDWIESIPRKGVIVSTHLPELKPRTFKTTTAGEPAAIVTANFYRKLKAPVTTDVQQKKFQIVINDGFPDARIAPVDALMKQYRYFFKRPSLESYIMHGSAAGSYNLRMALAGFLSDTRALKINAGQLLMTRGAQMAIFIAARMILKPGSKVVVAEPNYAMASNIFEHFGAKLIRIRADENGIDVDAIAGLCKRSRPDMIYLIPHHHHPTTVTLSAERRMKLLELVRKYKIPVIEDDYDYDFHYGHSPLLPLASADHNGLVLYIGSITKSFASSIRVGYLVADAGFISHAAQLKEMIDIRGDVLLEEALSVLFNNGDMQRHLKKSLKIYHERRDLFCDMLTGKLKTMLSFTKPSGGMAVWARFNNKYKVKDIALKARAKGLFLSDGSFYNTGKHVYNAVRMGFASLNEKEMLSAIEILEQLK